MRELLMISSVFLGACDTPAPVTCLSSVSGSGKPVATIASLSLDSAQLQTRFAKESLIYQKEHASVEQVREFVEEQIRFELLVRSALERGLANDPDVIEVAHKAMVRKLLQQTLPDMHDMTKSPEDRSRLFARLLDDLKQRYPVAMNEQELAALHQALQSGRESP